MPIPDYQGFMLPLLRAVGDGRTYSLRDLTTRLADEAGITSEERDLLLPSGTNTVVSNRVNWAKTYLKKAGLIEQPARGSVVITQAGRDLLARKPATLDRESLKVYPSFVLFLSKHVSGAPTEGGAITGDRLPSEPLTETPEESIESAFGVLRSALADELIERLKAGSPEFFERTVVRLLVAMGYGGSLADAGHVMGKPGDGGIDGLIKEDKLGLDAVYIQAKRWEGTVGRPAVQGFAGSMEGVRARKGVFITTSSFSKDAYDYVERIERKIVLIDGEQLAELMIDHDVGVTTARTYTVKKADLDFFAEDERG
jgi:restriction system protein